MRTRVTLVYPRTARQRARRFTDAIRASRGRVRQCELSPDFERFCLVNGNAFGLTSPNDPHAFGGLRYRVRPDLPDDFVLTLWR